MNWLIVFQLIFLIIHFDSQLLIKADSIYERTFKILHQEPPPPKSFGRHLVQDAVISQKVDNFDKNNNGTWLMRYKANPEHYKPGGPIFIFIGGEWAISNSFITGGHFYDMAREHNGYLFYTEHRYYGKSFPTKDLTVNSLKYLSVGQALADLANFIKIQKQKPQFKNSKVIIAGGSYSATMVAWFRQKYPDLAVGGWSSSAPLFAKVDFQEYHEVTGNAIKLLGGEKCYNRIENGVKSFEEMFDNKRFDELKVLLNICDNFDTENKFDVMAFFSVFSNIAGSLVQGHTMGAIKRDCNIILNETNDAKGVLKWILSYLENDPEKCNDFTYDAIIESINYTDISSNIFRQWIYQTCNEFGWYQTFNSTNQPYGRRYLIEFNQQMCNDVYGITKEKLYKNVEDTNALYGGWEPKVSNVYFTHGQIDPWHPMGITVNDDGENNVIPLYSHCNDFGSIDDKDTADMKASKMKISKLVRKWLSS